MPPSAEAGRQVVERYLAAAAALDVDAYMREWTPDGRLEMPFHPDPAARVLRGAGAIRDRMVTAISLMESVQFDPPHIRTCEEAGTFVLEYTGRGRMRSGGEYANTYIVVAELRDDKVALWREYFDPSVRTTALSSGERPRT